MSMHSLADRLFSEPLPIAKSTVVALFAGAGSFALPDPASLIIQAGVIGVALGALIGACALRAAKSVAEARRVTSDAEVAAFHAMELARRESNLAKLEETSVKLLDARRDAETSRVRIAHLETQLGILAALVGQRPCCERDGTPDGSTNLDTPVSDE